MMLSSDAILQRLQTYHPRFIDLTLKHDYSALLEKLGNPHKKLPPIIHVAGTNGKGSTIAFLRAMFEAAGKRAHIYTSPHLVRFHERIVLAGKMIDEDILCATLLEVEKANARQQLTFFEMTTAAAFLAFSRVPADVLLLEVGLGGRLDATNIIENPALGVITRISHDHMEYLGGTLEKIAGEKAGIFKKGMKAVIAPQSDEKIFGVFEDKARAVGATLFSHGKDWHYEVTADGTFTYKDTKNSFALPAPSLLGAHQYANAATAVTAALQFGLSQEAVQQGIMHAQWPARLQHLTQGPLVEILPEGSELWLDGGHNDSAGEALALQAKAWGNEKPLKLIVGMLAAKKAEEFLRPLAPYVQALAAIPIPEEPKSMQADELARIASSLSIPSVVTAVTPEEAIKTLAAEAQPARFLITGSLYLAGWILGKQV
jgi:dihydrofolate synthase/folylpolyglutamate synthase